MATNGNMTANADGKWAISIDHGTITTSNSTKTLTLLTAGTYADKDVVVTSTATKPSAATLGASATGSATIGSVTVGTKTDGAYPVTGSANITGTASASTTASGYATKGTTTGSGSTTGTASLNASLSPASVTVTGSATVTPNRVTAANGNAKVTATTTSTTQPSSGYYIGVTPATAASTTITQTPSNLSAGYLGSADEITTAGSVTGGSGSKYYVGIQSGSVSSSDYNSTSQTGTNLSGYTEKTVTVPSGGSLVLSEGYYPKTFITLDAMLDGKPDTAGTAAGDLKNGYIAYDVDGNKLTGTLPQLTSTNFTASGTSLGGTEVTLSGPTYAAGSDKFTVDVASDQSASATISVAAAKEGWIAKDENAFSGTISSGTISGSKTLNKIAGNVSVTGNNISATLAKGTKGADETWTDAAASSSVTTTLPTTGVYVKVSASGSTTITGTPSVTTAGYGTSDHHGLTAGTKTVSASGTTYVPIKTGSAAVTSSQSISVSAGTPTLQTSGTYKDKYTMALSGSKSITGTVSTAGWISSVSSANVSAAGTAVLNAAALTHNNTATETKVAVGVSGTRSTNLADPESDTTYYVTVNGSQTAAGSVTHSASVSEGYVPTAGLSSDANITTSASVTGNGDKVYLKSTSITNNVTKNNVTGYSDPVTVASSTTVPQIKFQGSATSGAVYNDISTEKYINYYTGAYTLV